MTSLASQSHHDAKTWPTQPGIYMFKDEYNRFLYIGKAKNLRNRLRSYFHESSDKSPKTLSMVKKIQHIEYIVTDTELEALLLESTLIKKHRPRYNIRLRDDKNYPYIALDMGHHFPKFRILRRVDLSHPKTRFFGPYVGNIHEMTRTLFKTFQLRDCSEQKFKNRKRPCLNYEIGNCTAPCVGYVNEMDYRHQVEGAIQFLEGKNKKLILDFKEAMLKASQKEEFEKASIYRDKMMALRHLHEKQQAVFLGSRLDVDVLGVYQKHNEPEITWWTIILIRGGKMVGKRSGRCKLGIHEDESMKQFLEQLYFDHLIPDEIWVCETFPHMEEVERELAYIARKKVRICVKRGERALKLIEMAFQNAKLTYQKEEQSYENAKALSALPMLQELLQLKEPPNRIEGFDVSNFQGQSPAIALVLFVDEKPCKSGYRLYHPRHVQGQNDFAMIYEGVKRRYSNTEMGRPDLILIDGGVGQLNAARRALMELQLSIPLLALAKSRTQSDFKNKKIISTQERIFIPQRKNPIVLPEGHRALRLLQNIRDEVHRFSVRAHSIRRKKENYSSFLDDIQGIGPKGKQKILLHFSSKESLLNASIEDFIAIGIRKKIGEQILAYVKQNKNVKIIPEQDLHDLNDK